MTDLNIIYNEFLSSITDDMYMEITPSETETLLLDLFKGALPWFEFPRFNLFDYDLELGVYNPTLT